MGTNTFLGGTEVVVLIVVVAVVAVVVVGVVGERVFLSSFKDG